MKTGSAPPVAPLLVLGIGVLTISSGSILVRLAQGLEMPSLVIAAWRMTLAAVILLPLALNRRRGELQRLPGSAWLLAIGSGFMLALQLGYLSAASVSLAVIAEPIGATLLALLLFHEVPSGLTLIGSGVLLSGIVYAIRPETQKRAVKQA